MVVAGISVEEDFAWPDECQNEEEFAAGLEQWVGRADPSGLNQNLRHHDHRVNRYIELSFDRVMSLDELPAREPCAKCDLGLTTCKEYTTPRVSYTEMDEEPEIRLEGPYEVLRCQHCLTWYTNPLRPLRGELL